MIGRPRGEFEPWPSRIPYPHPKIQDFTYKKAAVVPFDLTLSSLPTRALTSVAAVSAMAEAQLISASTTEVPPTHGSGSTLISLQNDVDALKREIDGLKTTVGSLVEEIKDLKRVKVELVGGVFFPSPPLSTRGTCRSCLCLRSSLKSPPILLTSSLASLIIGLHHPSYDRM